MKKLNTIALMLLVNFGIFLTLSFILKITGLDFYLRRNVGGYEGLFLFCLFFGMGASFLSLLLSKKLVKWRLRIQIIDSTNSSADARQLYETVRRLALKAGLPKTPEVGIYESPEVNAFATGPSQDDSLVAVSTGLIAALKSDEIEGVLGHELSHVANGDMVRMTLLQGVMNAMVMFAARIAAQVVVSALQGNRDRDSRRGNGFGNIFLYYVIVQAFEVAFGLLGMIVINAYSRRREFRADRGGADLAGRQKMIQALQALQLRSEFIDKKDPTLRPLKITSGPQGLFAQLFSSHPPLSERIADLQSA